MKKLFWLLAIVPLIYSCSAPKYYVYKTITYKKATDHKVEEITLHEDKNRIDVKKVENKVSEPVLTSCPTVKKNESIGQEELMEASLKKSSLSKSYLIKKALEARKAAPAVENGKISEGMTKKDIRDLKKVKASDDEVLQIIFAILIPPLGVYLHEDALTTNFWIDLLLTVLLWLPGVIFALLVVTDTVSID